MNTKTIMFNNINCFNVQIYSLNILQFVYYCRIKTYSMPPEIIGQTRLLRYVRFSALRLSMFYLIRFRVTLLLIAVC